MPATDRLAAERRFHDRQADDRAAALADPSRLRFADADWLDHETWVRPAVARLGPLSGRQLLDFGCGHGMASVVFARTGAVVTAFDLSPRYLPGPAARPAANAVLVTFAQADGDRLPSPDGSFDAVWGNAVLHPLDLAVAAPELRRVLRPGGVAVFCEPWGENPLLNLARRRLPYPGKQRTPDEVPLRQRDVRVLRELFPSLLIEGFQLLSMARRVFRWAPLTRLLDRSDAMLLSR